MKDYQLEYSRLLEELVNSGRYDTRDDFTVVLQPHQRDLKPIVDVRSINYPQNFVQSEYKCFCIALDIL